ncbi:Uncharacterized protein APZ42_003741, partial [Daphnia magna]
TTCVFPVLVAYEIYWSQLAPLAWATCPRDGFRRGTLLNKK